MAAQILSASEFSDFLYYLGRSRFFSQNNGYVLPIEIKSGKPAGGLRYNHTALDYLFQVTPRHPLCLCIRRNQHFRRRK